MCFTKKRNPLKRYLISFLGTRSAKLTAGVSWSSPPPPPSSASPPSSSLWPPLAARPSVGAGGFSPFTCKILSSVSKVTLHKSRRWPLWPELNPTVANLPGCDATPLHGYPQQFVAGAPIYKPRWKEECHMEKSVLSKETTGWLKPGLELHTFT